MSQSVKQRMNAINGTRQSQELRHLFEAILTDLTAIRSTVAANVTDIDSLATAVDVLAAKLNADAGVDDTDYSDTNAAAVTAAAPNALTTNS